MPILGNLRGAVSVNVRGEFCIVHVPAPGQLIADLVEFAGKVFGPQCQVIVKDEFGEFC